MYCARCGTHNPAKATTCSQCGEELRSAPGPGTPGGRRCPMCSTVNAPDAVYCVQCGARVQLLADSDIPMPRSSYDDDYASDTNWFDTPPDASPAPAAPATGSGGRGWLAGLRGGDQDAAPPPAPPAETPATGGWLSSLRGGDETPPTATPGAPAPAAAPSPGAAPVPPGGGGSWLDSLRDASVAETPDQEEEPEAVEETTLPAWLQDSVPAPPATTPPAPPEAALPAWLSDSRPATSDRGANEPPPAPLPPWLAEEASAPPPATPELPAWLAGLRAPADEAEEAEETAEPEPPAAGALPPWLHEVEPRQAEPPAVPVAPGPPAAEVPPWLHEVAMPTDLEAVAPPPAPAPPPSNIPPWLAGLTDETEAPPAPPPAAQPESAAWEAAARAAAEPPAPEPPAPNVNLTDEIELPAWLRAAGDAPAPVPLPTASWGQEAEPAEPAPEPAGTAPTEPEAVAAEAAPAEGELVLPDWIEEPAPAEPPAEVPAQPPTAEEPPAVAADELPAPVPAEPATAETAAGGETPAAGAEPTTPDAPTLPDQPSRATGTGILFPAWLNELSTAPEPDAAVAPTGEGGLVSEEDLPAWLRALQPEARPAAPPAPLPPIAPLPAPAPAAEQLPEWLQALSGSTPLEEEIAAEEAPADLAEALRAATPGRVVRARPPRAGAVETFARLLNPPAPVVTPQPVPTRRQQILAWLFPDRLVYAVLLLAVVAMWAILRTPAIAPNPALAAPNAEARAFHALIAPSGVITGSGSAGGLAAPLPRQPVTSTAVLSPALVVYDWDASRYGEMHELSRAVTRDLVSNGRPFASVSLLPQGPGFADQVVNEVGDDPEFHVDLLSLPQNGGQYGVRYLNLGWRTGNEAAIHSLVSDPQGVLNARGTELSYDYRRQTALSQYPLIQQAPALRQYGVVILLVSDENDLRLWLEQLTSQVGVPVIAAVPVSLRAGVAPYLDPALAGLSPARLRGAIFGVQGASQLEQLRLGSRAVSTAEQIRQGRWLHTLSVALLVVAALLLLGFLGGIYRWSTRPRQ